MEGIMLILITLNKFIMLFLNYLILILVKIYSSLFLFIILFFHHEIFIINFNTIH